MKIARVSGVIAGAICTYQSNHIREALAYGWKATTMTERLASVAFGVIVLLAIMAGVRRWLSRSFYHGFVVASGLFLSFDIVVFHWVFQLHRITNGPEANVLEPLFVLFGSLLVYRGLKAERSRPKPNSISM